MGARILFPILLVLVLATTVHTSSSTGGSPHALCGVSQPVRLAVAGASESSVSLDLHADPGHSGPCVVQVFAPEGHLVKWDLSPTPSSQDENLSVSDESVDVDDIAEVDFVDRAGPCVLRLMLDGRVLHAVDLCDAGSVRNAGDLASKELPQNVTVEWTPETDPSRTLLVHSVVVSSSRKGIPSYDLCSVSTTLRPAPHGLESAVLLELRSPEGEGGAGRPCRVHVAAPTTHMLSLLLVPAKDSGSSKQSAEEPSEEMRQPSCGLSLLLACSEAEAWSVDLCDPNAAAAQSALHFTELFPNNVTLVWTPPEPKYRSAQVATAVLMTAVGKGKTCSGSQFYPCWRRARFQQLCVATALACDGFHNCPTDGNDEDPLMCVQNKDFIKDGVSTDIKEERERVSPSFVELIRQAMAIKADSNRRTHNQSFHQDESSQQDVDPTPDTLSNYGPWGYLMLGMLVCGAFLMLCGLWECCCRQPKTTPSTPSHTPTTVLMPSLSPGSVLVLDSDLDDDPSRPPAYEDLDQPPAYGALFPGQPKEDSLPPAQLLAVPVPVSIPVLTLHPASTILSGSAVERSEEMTRLEMPVQDSPS